MRTISRTNNFKKTLIKKTQFDYYVENNAHPSTLKLVEYNNKCFGEYMQNIVTEVLELDPPLNKMHDARKINLNLKFEIKSSRYWRKIKDFKWQHVMENHDYDYLILVGLDFDEMLMYGLSKVKLLELKQQNIIKQQGGAEGQGLWFTRKQIMPHLFKIDSKHEFYEYITIKI